MKVILSLILCFALLAEQTTPRVTVSSGDSRRSVLSQINIRTTPRAALGLLLGSRSCSEWIMYCIRAETSRLSEDDFVSYSTTDLPWPISDRDVVFRNRVERGIDGSITVRFKATPELRPLNPEFVRITDIEGYWTFRPLAGGMTEVTYLFSTDPGGLFPDWFVEHSLRRQPEESLLRMKQVLEAAELAR
jgi:hypothetical protein